MLHVANSMDEGLSLAVTLLTLLQMAMVVQRGARGLACMWFLGFQRVWFRQQPSLEKLMTMNVGG